MSYACLQCRREFRDVDFAASISGSIFGDEYADTFFLCPDCRLYTRVSWYDNFTGIETSSISGPIPLEEGDASIALIRQCDTPWDKTCRCAAHRAYFNNTLD